MTKCLSKFMLLCLPVCSLFAGQTRTWSQGEFADFEKGIVKNLSLRSDGQLTLAPLSRELFDTSSAYLWALAQDSKGNLYAGGGNGAKLYRIPPDGKGRVFFKSDETHVRSMTIDASDNAIVGTDPGGLVVRVSAAGEGFVLYQTPKREVTAGGGARGGAGS